MRIAVFCLTILLLFPAALAGFQESYYASRILRSGSYVVYRVYYHPTVEFFKLTVLNVSDTVLELEVVVTDLKHNTSKMVILYDVREGEYLPLDSWKYTVPYPFISPGLQKRDFISLRERRFGGLTVLRIGGEVWNYSFRTVFYYEDSRRSYAWDGETGVLMRYAFMDDPVLLVEMHSTNLWSRPFDYLPSPHAIIMSVIGVVFTHWEIWLAVIAFIIMRLAWGWLVGFIHSVRHVRRNTEMNRILRIVNDQTRKVKIVR